MNNKMFIRFVILQNDQDSCHRQGFFQAMNELEHNGVLLEHEQSIYDEIYSWFRKNLRKPKSFSKSSKPHAKAVALSWFKDSAVEHIKYMREIENILETHGVQTEMIRTEKPGYIVYEDKFQVAAEPFNETGA